MTLSLDTFSLDGKTVLITGASSGLGAHFAGVAVRAGAQVILAARRTERLAASVAGLGTAARALALDVTAEASIAACLAAAGPVDVLVNNAGIAETEAAIETTSASFDRVMETNLRGAFLMAQAFARARIAARAPGSIINIASILGFRVAGGVASYAISKAGIVQMTKALALEWARHGIRVNALAPGYIATEINAGYFQSEAGAAMLKRVPMRRLGEPGELDGPFLLLASDASSFMTGATIPVDGGHLVSTL
jgi:NAD(P)-dependent dehydrogenase (short-subunit alcohol dehydrogenase family)